MIESIITLIIVLTMLEIVREIKKDGKDKSDFQLNIRNSDQLLLLKILSDKIKQCISLYIS